MAINKRLIIIGIVVLCAVVGAIVGVLVATKSDSSSTSSEESANASGSTSSGSSGGTSSSTSKKSSNSSTGSSSVTATVTSDPTSVTYSLAAFAIGDWGTTVTKDSCCTRSETYNNFDVVAEDVVSSLMNTQAGDADVKPKAILSHGDEYGFFSLTASEDWLKLQYHTADDSWTFGSSMGATTAGGVETKHCWYIPADGTKGEECSS
ncbi:hypothetical protein PC112_g16596 [Phytophthora cactorum]|nr:hypothetical protein PC112_g16596 [Phytophthora cactorum]